MAKAQNEFTAGDVNPRKRRRAKLAPTPQATKATSAKAAKSASEAPRIAMKKKGEVTESERPSAKAEARQKETLAERTFAERLVDVDALVPQGRGPYGRILKGASSGAAAGATLGEALAQMQREKSQRGQKPGAPTSTSGQAMSDRFQKPESLKGKPDPNKKLRDEANSYFRKYGEER